MENTVIFRPRQQLLADDVSDIQDFAEAGIDHIVEDGVTGSAGAQYRVGFEVAQASVNEVTVAAGRYYEGGKRYARETPQTLALLSMLPTTNKKKVALVVWGTDEETNIQQRKFRIDPVTRTSEPDDVAMTAVRLANIGTKQGVASSDPQLPTIDSGNLHFATVTLTPTGIELIEMVDASLLPSVVEVEGRTAQLEAWRSVAEPAISTLRSDLAALGDAMAAKPSQAELDSVKANLAVINAKLGTDDAAVGYKADLLIDLTTSDTDHAGYDADVEEGIRSAKEATSSAALALFSSIDPTVSVVSGNMWPKFTEEARISVQAYSGEISISQYAAQERTWVKMGLSRQRVRVGYRWTTGWETRWWDQSAFYWASRVFNRGGDSWLLPTGVVRDLNPVPRQLARRKWFWWDTILGARWEFLTTSTTKTGAIIAQTFLNAQSQIITSVDLHFTTLGASGDVTVFLTETTGGAPDFAKSVAECTVLRADLKPNREATKFAFAPAHLEAGKRYAFVIVTAGDHKLALADKGAYTAGTLFYSTDGSWFQGDLTKDLMFKVNFAKFERTFLQVEMTSLNLSGGMQNLSLNYDKALPDGTELWWEVQPEGTGPWKKIAAEGGNDVFTSLPSVAKLRAVMVGTPDIMPMIRLTGSVAEVSRSKMGFTHFAEQIAFGAASSDVKVIVDFDAWDAAHNTTTISIMSPADANEAADSVETITLPDGGVRKIASFTPAAFTGCAPKIVTTTDDRKIQPVVRTVVVLWY